MSEYDPGDLEPYCAECGSTIGQFIGYENNHWYHFTGSGTAADPNVIHGDPGHEPAVAWREPAGERPRR
jgi:hypothetical protein